MVAPWVLVGGVGCGLWDEARNVLTPTLQRQWAEVKAVEGKGSKPLGA